VIVMLSETRIRNLELPEPPRAAERPVETGSAFLYGSVAIAAIWLSVVLLSLFSPDLVSGTTQDHFPIAMVIGLLTGLAATRSVVKAATRGIGSPRVWVVYDLIVCGIWLAVALVSIYVPVIVSGTDPTQVPIGAVVAPIAGAIATGAVSELFVAPARSTSVP
jgi:hypothetical protein